MRRLPRAAWLCLVLGALAVVVTTTVLAQSGGTYDLSWNSAKSGGVSGGGSYVVQGVAGETGGGASSGGSYSVAGGFVTGLTGAAAVPSASPAASPSPTATPRTGPGGNPIRAIPPMVAKDGIIQ